MGLLYHLFGFLPIFIPLLYLSACRSHFPLTLIFRVGDAASQVRVNRDMILVHHQTGSVATYLSLTGV